MLRIEGASESPGSGSRDESVSSTRRSRGIAARLCAVLLLASLATGPAFANSDESKGDDARKKKSTLKQTEESDTIEDRSAWRGRAHAWWRVEGTVKTAWKSGHEQRAGDFGLRAIVDYEVPVRKHLSVSPRMMPIMYWDENNAGDNEIFSAGAGVSLRGYPRAYEFRGFYAELGGILMGQTNTHEGSSSYFNFMEEIGVGYVFDSDWNVAFKVGHISNADLHNSNAGVNWASLSVGYSFRRAK